MNPHSIFAWTSKNSLLETGAISEVTRETSGFQAWLSVSDSIVSSTNHAVNFSDISEYENLFIHMKDLVIKSGDFNETGLEHTTTYFVNEHSAIWPNCANYWAVLWVPVCMVHLTVCSYHVTCTFRSESTLYTSLNIKGLLAQNKCYIWGSSDCSVTLTHKHLLRKGTLSPLAKVAKWLSGVVNTYL